MKLRNNRRFSWAIALAMLGGFAAYPLATRTARADEHEKNPRIHRALEALHDAREELRDAPHDYHGHKQEALDAIDHAIDRLDRIKDW